MVESLVGGKKAEVEAEAEDGEQHLFTKDSPGATMGNTAAAAKSTGGKQATPSVLQAAASIFKPVTKSEHRSFGGGGARLKAEATKQRIRSTVVSSAVFRKLAPDRLEAVIEAMEEVHVAKGETIIRQVAVVVVAVVQ